VDEGTQQAPQRNEAIAVGIISIDIYIRIYLPLIGSCFLERSIYHIVFEAALLLCKVMQDGAGIIELEI
jgi:hypothetical protein